MVVILKKDAKQEKIEALIEQFKKQNLSINFSKGSHATIIGLIGDTSVVDMDLVRANEIVEDVRRISEPFKASNRRFHPDDTIITVEGRNIGEGFFNVIAGPCSVESREQLLEVADSVKKSGAKFLRGGAFKPRTSPYSFQGLEDKGLEYLLEAKKALLEADALPEEEELE